MSKSIAYQIKQNHSIVLFVNSQLVTIGKDDLNYNVVLKALKASDWKAVERALSVKKAIAGHTDGRVEIFGDEVHIDKKPLPKAVSDRIITLFQNTEFDLKPVFRLLENIEANPAEFSRAELYLFLEHCNLPFTPDGHFLAYKMVNDDYYDWYTGHTFLNTVGSKHSMPREEVDPNRNNTCSKGLHFCSYNYVSTSFGKRLMVVKINPADVVSIPKDYNNAKGRCWKYEVVDEIFDNSDSIPKDYTDKYAGTADAGLFGNEKKVKVNAPTKAVSNKPVAAKPAPAKPVAKDSKSVDYSTKITETDVKKIRKMLKGDWTLVGIAEQYGISARQVARIRDGEAWSHVK